MKIKRKNRKILFSYRATEIRILKQKNRITEKICKHDLQQGLRILTKSLERDVVYSNFPTDYSPKYETPTYFRVIKSKDLKLMCEILKKKETES
jgi:hypothetical protein